MNMAYFQTHLPKVSLQHSCHQSIAFPMERQGKRYRSWDRAMIDPYQRHVCHRGRGAGARLLTLKEANRYAKRREPCRLDVSSHGSRILIAGIKPIVHRWRGGARLNIERRRNALVSGLEGTRINAGPVACLKRRKL